MPTDARSPIFRRLRDAIETESLTKGQIQGFVHYPDGRRTNLTVAEHDELYDMLRARPIRLTPDHEAKAIAFLRRYRSRIHNLPAEVVDDFHHFTFDGDSFELRREYGPPFSTPVWMLHTNAGDIWRYYVGSWQSGNGYAEAWPNGRRPQ